MSYRTNAELRKVDTEGDEPWLEQQRSAIQERRRANTSSGDNRRCSFRETVHLWYTITRKLSDEEESILTKERLVSHNCPGL
jgi:hypothetical protein